MTVVTYSNPTLRGDVCVWAPELGLFVAIGIDDDFVNRSHLSVDGVNWTDPVEVPLGNATDLCWSPDLGILLAVGNNGGSGDGAYSDDGGLTWNAIADCGVHNNAQGCCWSPALGIFLVVGQSSVDSKSTSPDAVTWTGQGATAGDNWDKCAWSPDLDLFVAVGRNTTNVQVISSPDGSTWTPQGSPFAAIDVQSLTAGNDVIWSSELGLFVAVGQTTNIVGSQQIITSPDGATWTGQGLPWGSSGSAFSTVGGLVLNKGVWGGDLTFKAYGAIAGNQFREYDSPDATTWTLEPNPFGGVGGRCDDICFSDDLDAFLEVGRDDTVPASVALLEIGCPPQPDEIVSFAFNGTDTVIATIENAVPGRHYLMQFYAGDGGASDVDDVAVSSTLVLTATDVAPDPTWQTFEVDVVNYDTGEYYGTTLFPTTGSSQQWVQGATWTYDGVDTVTVRTAVELGIDYYIETTGVFGDQTSTPVTATISPQTFVFVMSPPAGESRFGAWLANDEGGGGGSYQPFSSRMFDACIENDGYPGNPVSVTQYQRIYGWRVNISDDALETLDPVLTSPEGGL